jgi:hypothetical protein
MMEHQCLYEERWGQMLTKMEMFTDKFCKHVEEGEKEGGYRDRLLLCEREAEIAKAAALAADKVAKQVATDTKLEISTIKKGYWKACIISGLVGGIVGGTLSKIGVKLFELLEKAILL